jgi:6-phosphofructo-2-kinase / fructose-2,6-biphosphatase 2
MTGRLVCVLVGLPARGKTYIGQKICKYVNWLGVRSQVFNVGTYRRKVAGARLHHGFFDSENIEAVQLRQQAALDALNDLLKWIMEEDHGVAIYDATNTTRERREWIKSHIGDKCQVLYVESVCTDQNIILSNIFEVKISGPDYLGTDTSPEEAANDFQQRMKHYEKVYQPLNRAEDGHVSFVKLINVQQNIIVNKVTGWIPSRIAYYLMNLHITPRKIFLSRHGESEYNVLGKIGGDSLLSERGTKYSELLPGILYKYLQGGSVKVLLI